MQHTLIAPVILPATKTPEASFSQRWGALPVELQDRLIHDFAKAWGREIVREVCSPFGGTHHADYYRDKFVECATEALERRGN